MKLKFKNQQYQTDATKAVVDIFKGQQKLTMDAVTMYQQEGLLGDFGNIDVVSNAKLHLSDNHLISNIQKIQENNLIPSSDFKELKNYSIEMETGTGKTYTYINTMYELYNNYGFRKFIIVVPSVAIREGVAKSFEVTESHFQEKYGTKIRHYIYNSSTPQHIQDFSGGTGIQCIIMNYQAFNTKGENSRGEADRKIYQERDEFGSNRPIDLLKACNPIMIIDEPQKISNSTEQKIEEEFNPLFVLRYSATHKKGKEYNKVYTLNAIDAYNQRLVKKIEVVGLELVNDKSEGTYVYVNKIEATKKGPIAHLEIEKKTNNGVKKFVRKFVVGDDLYVYSNELQSYKGYVISEINALHNWIEFTNGELLSINQMIGESNKYHEFRVQVRETIQTHLEKESMLFKEGIKVLSLFFIDKVSNYRDLEDELGKGKLAYLFEELYEELTAQLPLDPEYKEYLRKYNKDQVHNGYFSVDKKGNAIDSKEKKSGKELIGSDDVNAYDLILKDKERLLSFDEPTRFIFSHSALREGWDNPNVFQICTLRETKSEISKRQEIGRGLRICVNQNGERMDVSRLENDFHNYNTLTVIANESYDSFSKTLQSEIAEDLTERRVIFEVHKLVNVTLYNGDEKQSTFDTNSSEELLDHFVSKGYVDFGSNEVTKKMKDDFVKEKLDIPRKLEEFKESLYIELNNLFFSRRYNVENGSEKNVGSDKFSKVNKNFHKEEFQELWNRINIQSKFEVDFDSKLLIENAINRIDHELNVGRLEIVRVYGAQKEKITEKQLREEQSMIKQRTSRNELDDFTHSKTKYDLVGEVKKRTNLMRTTIIQTLQGISAYKFEEYKYNPEEFIIQVSNILNDVKASCVIEGIKYYKTSDRFDTKIFVDNKLSGKLGVDVQETKRHIYDYVKTDSAIEFKFAQELENEDNVIVYSKLPNGFKIPTPIGNYNPDWAIVINKAEVKHVYFIAETKGTNNKEELSRNEKAKISCAKKHFESISDNEIKYDVVKDYKTLNDMLSN